jgi:hypothetical protein
LRVDCNCLRQRVAVAERQANEQKLDGEE